LLTGPEFTVIGLNPQMNNVDKKLCLLFHVYLTCFHDAARVGRCADMDAPPFGSKSKPLEAWALDEEI
jgi:hypothetical protein